MLRSRLLQPILLPPGHPLRPALLAPLLPFTMIVTHCVHFMAAEVWPMFSYTAAWEASVDPITFLLPYSYASTVWSFLFQWIGCFIALGWCVFYFACFSFPDSPIHIPLEALFTSFLPNAVHPLLHFLFATLPQTLFAWSVYPASGFYFVYMRTALAAFILVLVILAVFEGSVYTYWTLLPLAIAYKIYREVCTAQDPSPLFRYKFPLRSARRLKYLACGADVKVATNTDAALTVPLPPMLRRLGQAWLDLRVLSIDDLDYLKRECKTRLTQLGRGAAAEHARAGLSVVADLLKEGPADREASFEGFPDDFLMEFDELIGVVVHYLVLVRSIKHLSRPFRLRSLRLIVFPPPFARYLPLDPFLSRSLIKVLRCSKRTPSPASAALHSDFLHALHDACNTLRLVPTSPGRMKLILATYLRHIGLSALAKKNEEDLNYAIIRALFVRKEKAVLVKQWRLTQA